MGQDQVSGGVSVLCWLAAIVANVNHFEKKSNSIFPFLLPLHFQNEVMILICPDLDNLSQKECF